MSIIKGFNYSTKPFDGYKIRINVSYNIKKLALVGTAYAQVFTDNPTTDKIEILNTIQEWTGWLNPEVNSVYTKEQDDAMGKLIIALIKSEPT